MEVVVAYRCRNRKEGALTQDEALVWAAHNGRKAALRCACLQQPACNAYMHAEPHLIVSEDALRDVWPSHEKWHAHILLVGREFLVQQGMLPQVESIVRGEEDVGVVQDTQLLHTQHWVSHVHACEVTQSAAVK